MTTATPERLSLELTNRCDKGCDFCYAGSTRAGTSDWDLAGVLALVRDAAAHGTRAVSFGGGEPTGVPWLFALLRALDGVVFRSFTTHGLALDAQMSEVVAARPDKVHVSIHYPDRGAEVVRVAGQVRALEDAGVRAGVNLLVRRSGLAAARRAARLLGAAGIGTERVVFLPMHGRDTPSPEDVAAVAGDKPFQSMSCLGGCAASPRFASIASDRSVALCSYTTARRPLEAPTAAALLHALDGIGLAYCGEEGGGLVGIRRRRDASRLGAAGPIRPR